MGHEGQRTPYLEATDQSEVRGPALVSVVILVDDRDLREGLMSRLQQQVCSFDVEILLVDSSQANVAERYSEEPRVRIISIAPESFEFGKTREFAFGRCRGSVIVTMSQDVLPMNERYLSTMASPILMGHADVVQGTTVLPPNEKVFFWEAEGVFYFTSLGREFERRHGGLGLSACSLAISRNAWEATGFSPARCCEDKVIQSRLFRQGFRLLENEEPNAFHGHRYTVRSLLQRCLLEGSGWACAGVKYRLSSALFDILSGHLRFGSTLARGLWLGQIRTPSELLFLVLRPAALFAGNLCAPASSPPPRVANADRTKT